MYSHIGKHCLVSNLFILYHLFSADTFLLVWYILSGFFFLFFPGCLCVCLKRGFRFFSHSWKTVQWFGPFTILPQKFVETVLTVLAQRGLEGIKVLVFLLLWILCFISWELSEFPLSWGKGSVKIYVYMVFIANPFWHLCLSSQRMQFIYLREFFFF